MKFTQKIIRDTYIQMREAVEMGEFDKAVELQEFLRLTYLTIQIGHLK